MSHEKEMKAVSPLLQQAIHISSIVGGVATVIFCIWAYQAGILHSKETLSAFIQQAGIWGPPLFIFLQILQTVVPIIPGALTSVAGVFIYGHIVVLFITTLVLSLVVRLSFTWFVSTEHPLSSLWSASAPMTSISVGLMRAIALTVSLSL